MNNRIEAQTRTLRELLDSQKYKVDYFQREYKWESKQLQQLLIDLEEAFFSNYSDEDTIEDVVNYNTYFLGPIILLDKGASKSIIDGQQRLTTLTLLLIHLNKLQSSYDEKENIDTLIYSRKHGRKTYNIEVPDRTDVLNALYLDKEIYDYDDPDHLIGLFADLAQKVDKKDESVQNMIDRFNDIQTYFSDKIRDKTLLMFLDYMKEKLIFVEIIAFNDDNAFTIFETMNDRGLSLSATEMLKGYLLASINKEEQRENANLLWKKRISKLHRYSVKEDIEFMKAWLRGQHAKTQRNRKKGFGSEDFGKIGTHFHTWVRENHKDIGLSKSNSVYQFITNDFRFYSNVYEKIIRSMSGEDQLNSIAFISSYYSIATSLSLPLYMSAISKIDSESIIDEKIKVVSKFLDVYSFGRSVNDKPIGQSSISYSIFTIIKKVRNKDLQELKSILSEELREAGAYPYNISSVRVTSQNFKFVRYLLCRLAYSNKRLEKEDILFTDFYSKRKKNRLIPIPIIPQSRFDIYQSEFEDEETYSDNTSLIGNYLLAPIEFFSKVDNLAPLRRIKYLKTVINNVPNMLPLEFWEFSLHDQDLTFNQNSIEERGNALNKFASLIWNDKL